MSNSDKTKETEKIVSSLEKLSKLRSDNVIDDDEFKKLKSELLENVLNSDDNGNNPEKSVNIYDGIDFSLNENETPMQNDIYEGIDFSLNKDDKPYIDTSLKKDANIYEGIDFSLDKTENSKADETKKAEKYFSKKSSLYNTRNNLLMDIEQLSRLLPAPIFIMGLCAAVLIYYVLIIFAQTGESMQHLLLLICIFAGVVPSFIIIPNSVKISRKSKKEKEINNELYEYYISSPYKNLVSFKGSDPYIFSEISDISDCEDLFQAEKKLYALSSDKKTLALNKQNADCSDNDELADYSAALYVFGSDLVHE